MQILQGMPILGFFDESLATMQRKFILYHENILGCQRNNPRGNVLPSLRSGGLFYPRCARVKQLPPFSSIGKNNFPPLVFLRLPKFFHNTRTSILSPPFPWSLIVIPGIVAMPIMMPQMVGGPAFHLFKLKLH